MKKGMQKADSQAAGAALIIGCPHRNSH